MPRPGTTTQRGYGVDHQAEREAWRPRVEAGTVDCHARRCLEPTRAITPGQPWHLGHTEDRTTWTGPEHERCNTSDGARRRGKTHHAKTLTPQRVTGAPIEHDEW